MAKIISEKEVKRLKEAFAGIDKNELAKKISGKKYARNWLSQVICGFVRVSPERALLIEKLSGVDKRLLRPDIWSDDQ